MSHVGKIVIFNRNSIITCIFFHYQYSLAIFINLDKALVSQEWLDLWPESKQYVLDISVSDHCALVIKHSLIDWGPKPFRYLDVWHTKAGFMDIVKEWWRNYDINGNEIWILKEKLKRLKKDLKVWNKEVFGHVNISKEKIMSKISELDKKDEDNGLDEEGMSERKHMFAELKRINYRQEVLHKQKSRVKWLEAGDLNTKFFHRMIRWRRMKNMIKGVKIENQWCEEPRKVKENIKNFFEKRFTEKSDIKVRLDNVQFTSINRASNVSLTSRSSEDEIKEAIWDCDSSKSPGPDGFNFNFIKQFWDTINWT